jgi:hypothetical protein
MEDTKTMMRIWGTTALTALLLASVATPAMAVFTECSVTRDVELANRPEGRSDPRFPIVEAGGKVAIRDRFGGWRFVVYYRGDETTYGWLPQTVLTNCRSREGTP